MTNNNFRPHIIITKEPASPIKREYKNGGGGGTYPRTNYRDHAAKVYKEIDQLKAIFAESKDIGTSKVYYRVEIPDGYEFSNSEGKILEKKYNVSSSDGKSLEKNLRSTIVGAPSDKVAHMSASKDSFDDLMAELSSYGNTPNNVGKSKFATIEGFSPIPFEEKISERFLSQFHNDIDEGDALLTTFPDLNEEDLSVVIKSMEYFFSQQQGKIISVLPGEEGAIIKVRSKKKTLQKLADSFVSIQSLDSADELMMEMSASGENISNNIVVKPNASNAFACIFDTGVSDIKYLKGSIIEHIYPFGENKGVGTSHGTFVASRIIYGDSIKDQISTGILSPDVRLVSVCMNKFNEFGRKEVTTTESFIKTIREVAEKWHKQIRVYNVSMSHKNSLVRDDFIHKAASEIDYLSRKYDILFVVCTGNITSASKPYPNYFADESSRIWSPGEAMLGLTIGSIANEEAAGSMAKKKEPSPFTRRGPGFSGHYKPDLVAHGGNCGNNWSSHDFLHVAGFSDNENCISYNRGTSFSTPIITRLAAKIFELIPSASACLVKAILIHCSEKELSTNFKEEDLEKLLGNGWPMINMLTNSTKNAQTFFYQGEVDYRDTMEVPFYVPESLIGRKSKNGQAKENVKIRATISFYPETNSTLKAGYCKSHIRTKIIKLDKNKKEKDVSFSASNSIDSDKYSTVVKMEKSFSREISGGEWKIFVAHESRWTLKNPKTKFAVVITVEDPKKDPEIDIFSAIRSECPNRYQNVLTVQNRIRT